MMRLKITIAYDGTPFKGWAKQPQMYTVQQTLEEALSEIGREPILIFGSGRTDAGVHADGQVAHFTAPEGNRMQPENWLAAVNTKLPPEVRVMECVEVPEDFHARFSAQSKTYMYRIVTTPHLHPHWHKRAWHQPRELDVCVLEACLKAYEGVHDFRHFSALRGNETETSSFRRHVMEASLQRDESAILISYTADGFLYKMVRLLTGVAIQVALGRLSLEEFQAMLACTCRNADATKYCAPSAGLLLKEVVY